MDLAAGVGRAHAEALHKASAHLAEQEHISVSPQAIYSFSGAFAPHSPIGLQLSAGADFHSS